MLWWDIWIGIFFWVFLNNSWSIKNLIHLIIIIGIMFMIFNQVVMEHILPTIINPHGAHLSSPLLPLIPPPTSLTTFTLSEPPQSLPLSHSNFHFYLPSLHFLLLHAQLLQFFQIFSLLTLLPFELVIFLNFVKVYHQGQQKAHITHRYT